MPWVYDPSHSQVSWAVKYSGLSLVRGLFNQMAADLNVEGEDPTSWSARVTIQAASVDSGIERRDEVMRGEEYFDVERYPTITFASTRVERDGDGYRVVGDATLHGITREISLGGRYLGEAADPRGVRRRGLVGETRLSRTDFAFHLPPLAQSMSDEIWLNVDVQATWQD